ncbi:MAG TPA: O-antigen ligase family protein [Negativicutes bacterium]|nr:O-antigen ligase family protein [Negativicutes bacterium]
MLTTARVDTAINYLVLAFAAVMGFSRGGIHTAFWLLIVATIVRYCWRPFPLTIDRDFRRAMLIFFGTLALSAIFSGDVAASFRFLGLTAVKILPVIVVVAVVKERKITEQAAVLMAGSMLVGAGVAFWQVLHGAVRGGVKSFLGVMDFGGIIGLLLPVLLIKGFDKETDGRLRGLFLFAAAMAMIALAYNGTRAAWVAVFVTLVTYVIINIMINKRKSLKPTIIIGVMLLAVAVAFAANPALNSRLESLTDMNFKSNSKRMVMWQYALDVFKSHPLLGVGLATIPTYAFTPEEAEQLKANPTYGHVHNTVLQVMAENGVVGLLGFLALFLTIAKTALTKLKEQQTRSWALIALLCTVDFLIHGLFDYTFAIATLMYSYWFIIGLAYVNFTNER